MPFVEDYIPRGPTDPAYTLSDGRTLAAYRTLPPQKPADMGDATTQASGDTFKDRILKALAAVIGYDKAGDIVVGLEDFIKSRAEEGAKRAVIKYGIIIVAAAIVLPILINKLGKK